MASFEHPERKLNFRNRARALLIDAASLVHADALAFRWQKAKPCARGMVVAMHETPLSGRDQFRQQLEFAAEYFTITSLEGFATLWDRPEVDRVSKPFLLFTFDDGRESNYTVAAPLLESFGGRGLFFVVPEFAECAGTGRALPFFRERINPNSKAGDEQWEDWQPMSPGQVADLAARGHAIGNHTLTHERLIGISDETLEREIGESARKLAAWSKKPVDAFAWTFGWDAVDARAWRVIRRYHRFCFSPCAGLVDPFQDDPGLLWRREIEARYSTQELRFAYSGLVDLWWRSRREKLQEMLQTNHTKSSR